MLETTYWKDLVFLGSILQNLCLVNSQYFRCKTREPFPLKSSQMKFGEVVPQWHCWSNMYLYMLLTSIWFELSSSWAAWQPLKEKQLVKLWSFLQNVRVKIQHLCNNQFFSALFFFRNSDPELRFWITTSSSEMEWLPNVFRPHVARCQVQRFVGALQVQRMLIWSISYYYNRASIYECKYIYI